METRVAVLEKIAQTTSATLERLERRLDVVSAEQRAQPAAFQATLRAPSAEQRAALEARTAELQAPSRALATDQSADFRWLLCVTLGGFGALLGVMAHGFHWQ